MLKRPLHLLSALSLIVCVGASVLWFRASESGVGDHFGWKRQQPDGRNWVHDEWSARSVGGRIQFVSFHKTTSPSGDGPPKAHIRFGEEGYFWNDAIEKAPAQKHPSESNAIDIKKTTTTRPTTAPATDEADAATPAEKPAEKASEKPAEKPAEKAFVVIDETSPTLRARGVSLTHWLLVAVTAFLPARWLLVTSLRKSGAAGADGSGHGNPDRVPLMARVFATVASLSILLAFALGLAWAKSWYVGDRVSWRDPARPQFVDVHSGKGELVVHFRRVDQKLMRSAQDLATAPNGVHWRQDPEATVGYTLKTFCFENENQSTGDGENRSITIAAPYWFLMIVALVLPTWWLRKQKHGPVKVSSFGRPLPSRGSLPIHSTQRPF